MTIHILPTSMALDCVEYIEADTGLRVSVTGELVDTLTEQECIAGEILPGNDLTTILQTAKEIERRSAELRAMAESESLKDVLYSLFAPIGRKP